MLHTVICFLSLHVISDWFSNIFTQKKKKRKEKKNAFSAACQIQNYISKKL